MSDKPRVLLVDDEQDNLDALKRLLRRDFDVLAALSGEEGLQLVQKNGGLDAVISDQRMPGMSGSEFLEKVRTMDGHATRILLTGFADIDAVVEAVNRGQIWRYISKPWEPEDFRLAVQQASERTRMSRSLEQSRRELEKALNELRAKDWARERLLQILLHEFRTAPQILEGLESLDGGGPDAPARKNFIENLRKRFSLMEEDIQLLLKEEKRFSDLPKEPLKLSDVLKEVSAAAKAPFESHISGEEAPVLSNRATLNEALKHLTALVARNSGRAQPKLSLDSSGGPAPVLFVSIAIEGSGPLMPEGLSGQKIEAALAWTALLEPFVGSEDFAHHSTGLRVETARLVRALAAAGGRSEFQLSGQGRHVELLVSFKATLA